jgi:hypothetical protein
MSKTIYIVGGGPSLDGYRWRLLDGHHIIAVNRSYEPLPNAEIVYFSDARFFYCKEHHASLLKHKGRKVSIDKRIVHPNVELYKSTGRSGIDTREGCLKNGNNSGYAAINLAIHEGATFIVLMGFDMRQKTVPVTNIKTKKTIEVTGKSHWHDGHKLDGAVIHTPHQVYKTKMLPYFYTLVEPLRKLGVIVVNAVGMDGSELRMFPIVSLYDAHILKEQWYESTRNDKE